MALTKMNQDITDKYSNSLRKGDGLRTLKGYNSQVTPGEFKGMGGGTKKIKGF